MAARVLFAETAQADLDDLFSWIAERTGRDRALAYIGRIERFCSDLVPFPHRGTARDDIRPGLRIVGFERRVTIAFTIRDTDVIIVRILYAGRSIEPAIEE